MNNNNVSFKEILLEKTDFFLEKEFSHSELEYMDYHTQENPYTGGVTLQLRKSFYTEKKIIEETVSFDNYKTWWDHFKDANFPKWLLRKFPAKKETINKIISFNRDFVFPDAYISGNPHLGKFIQMDTNLKIENEGL